MTKNLLLVGLGGALGSVLRYSISFLLDSKKIPFATLAVNITGSFVIGILLALSIKEQAISDNWKLFLATGVCGGFTTFSAFSLENLAFLQNGKYYIAILYIFSSIILSIAATWLGFKFITHHL